MGLQAEANRGTDLIPTISWGKDTCRDGICVIATNVTSENMMINFPNLGIQCVKRRDVEDSLAIRSKHNVDPFKSALKFI